MDNLDINGIILDSNGEDSQNRQNHGVGELELSGMMLDRSGDAHPIT